MTLSTAYWCVLIAALLPYCWVALAKASAPRYDNRDPRGWIARQDHPRLKRAYNAHLNALEAFAPFAAGVVLAQLAGIAHDRIAMLAVAFVILRLLHGIAYVADLAWLRSLAWFAAIGCVVALLAQAAISVA
ncbi:MAPEG family protein [Luteimonas sp. 3794]|uniref:MAPEG family protein n=1 Tax=Luteimonas sp. 3794 TaxID=2817730 RepID=UPI00285CBB8D|nr:MAPEG family protein [Luteimonas sp. 3794]MDR6989976.1 putative MAPEG superfamily protein [Luteimonas sp. 3794]